MGSVGSGSVRPPGEGGVLIVFSSLQGELQKFPKNGVELHHLMGTINDILGGSSVSAPTTIWLNCY